MRQIKPSPVTEPRFNPRAAQMSLMQNPERNFAQQSTAQTSQMSSRERGRAAFPQPKCRANTIILLFTETSCCLQKKWKYFSVEQCLPGVVVAPFFFLFKLNLPFPKSPQCWRGWDPGKVLPVKMH